MEKSEEFEYLVYDPLDWADECAREDYELERKLKEEAENAEHDLLSEPLYTPGTTG